jgi:hypothetical protein
MAMKCELKFLIKEEAEIYKTKAYTINTIKFPMSVRLLTFILKYLVINEVMQKQLRGDLEMMAFYKKY